MQVAEKISVINDAIVAGIQEKVVVSGTVVTSEIAINLMNELRAAGGGANLQNFYKNLAEKTITPERLAELAAMDPVLKNLLSKIVNAASKNLFSGPTGAFLGMFGSMTSNGILTNFIMVQAIESSKKLATELRKDYTDEVILQVPAQG